MDVQQASWNKGAETQKSDQDTIATINYNKIGNNTSFKKWEVNLVSLLEYQSHFAHGSSLA